MWQLSFSLSTGFTPCRVLGKSVVRHHNNFGKNLNLSPVEIRTMSRYLLDNSAGRVNDDISNNILQTLKYDPVVVQITKMPYFVNKHSHLDDKEKMKDIGQCDSCHQRAAQGKY
ncbi:MAG: hypothetical protein QNL05_07365 [Gammaproteobacteria bacterium]|nr:hypothetical protein [Gammaproteobacteria bacterium]